MGKVRFGLVWIVAVSKDRVGISKYPFAFALRIRSHPNDRYSREADGVKLGSVESKREAIATGQSVKVFGQECRMMPKAGESGG